MKINKYWYKSESYLPKEKKHLVAWGGSTISNEDAQRESKIKLDKIIAYFKGGLKNWAYGYMNSEIREPINAIKEDSEGHQLWAVTRNRYGALILNSADVVFIDIDCKPLGCLFFMVNKSREKRLMQIYSTIEQSEIDCCVYETRNGYRLLITNKLIKPDSDEVAKIMQHFKSDKLYATLCRKTNCYRARLTPKPYRIGLDSPKITPSNIDSQISRDWINSYEKKSEDYAICKLLRENKSPITESIISEIKTIHDKYCLRSNSHKLA